MSLHSDKQTLEEYWQYQFSMRKGKNLAPSDYLTPFDQKVLSYAEDKVSVYLGLCGAKDENELLIPYHEIIRNLSLSVRDALKKMELEFQKFKNEKMMDAYELLINKKRDDNPSVTPILIGWPGTDSFDETWLTWTANKNTRIQGILTDIGYVPLYLHINPSILGIRIKNNECLVMKIPMSEFSSPFTWQELTKRGSLPQVAEEVIVRVGTERVLQLPTLSPGNTIEVKVKGKFNWIAIYGAQV